VQGYPTIKLFAKNSAKGSDYQGERTADAITRFVEEQGVRRVGSKTNVVSLSPADFDAVVNTPEGARKTSVLVKFFAPWCGHCKHLAPEYEKAAKVFARDAAEVVLAEVDCDAHGKLCEKFGVSGYPTLKWFPKGGADVVEYEGGRTVQDIVDFVDNRCGLQRAIDGRLKETAGRNTELDVLVAQFKVAPEKAPLIKQAKELAEKLLPEAEAKRAKYYAKVMEAIVEKGEGFVAAEKTRIDSMLAGTSLSESKIEEFTVRRNILNAF
jgi:protein disulfide-isomerase A6